MNPLFIVLLFGFGEHPLGFIIAAVLLLLLLRMLFNIFKDGYLIARSEMVKTGKVFYSSEAESAVRMQLGDFSYFRKLTPQRKTEFIHRVLNFIETHAIDGVGEFEPDLYAKIHVAAAATQLTLGLEDFSFTHFETILLYPGIFKMNEEGPLMKGATTPNGVIRISFKDFKEGYANPTDKLNVGLHELGHALFMEFLKMANAEDDIRLKGAILPYLEEADKILDSGKHHNNFLRDYAFTNRHEFFAVSVEHFFEAPKEFQEQLPVLYNVVRNLLKQDPAGDKSDYGIVRLPF